MGVNLHVKESRAPAERVVSQLPHSASIEEELDGMLASVAELDPSQPDIIISTCMALMARCTELYIELVRLESKYGRAKFVRTMQLQKVMDLLDYQFKGASRLVEVARQELDTTR